MPLLTLSGLTVEFPTRRGLFTAVRDIDLSVERGEILGLVGESGAGKSTIGAAIMGLLDPPGRIAKGEITLDGLTLSALDEPAMEALRGRKISMIFQDPLTSLNPLMTVGEQLSETIRHARGLSRPEAWAETLRLIEAVGIRDGETRAHQYPHQFSGGMRQRVVIALALCTEPDLIIADEPTTALDVSVQAQILELIKELARVHGAGVILVTHDMGVIAQTADRVAVMHRGVIVETGPTAQIIHAPQHDYTRRLIAAVPRADVTLHRFANLSGDAAALPDLSRHWLGQAGGGGTATSPLLEVQDLTIRFQSRRALLARNRRWFDAAKSVSFAIRPGEVLGLVGESGSGKSTVARAIAGIYRPTEGAIRFEGQDLVDPGSAAQRQALRRQIQMIFQDPFASLNPRMRVAEIVAEPIRFNGLAPSRAEERAIVGDLLEVVGLGAAAGAKYPHEFSGGQRQRISIARALATRPRFLICDEPTSALDVSIQAQILNLLKDLRDALSLTMLFISHDLPVVRQMCDRVAVMRQGEIVELAETEALFTAPQHSYTQELLALMPRI